METIRTKHLRNKITPYLKPTKNNRIFDGILQNATLGGYNVGIVYNATPYFEDGTFIQLSDIVKASSIGGDYYVETKDKMRFLISDIEYNSSLPLITESIDSNIKHVKQLIESNPKHYSKLQWS